jgi:hypothetical protein
MAEAYDIYGTAFKNGSATLLALVVGQSGANIVPADLSAIHYTVYLLDDQDPDRSTAVANHNDVALVAANVVFGTLQTDPLWTVDATGYNFRHVLSVATHQAFTTAGRNYLVEYRLTPTSGEVIIVRFRLSII